MSRWYKDRDFPEIKCTRFNDSSEILAVVPNPKQLERLIEVHNEVVDENQYLKESLTRMYGHQKEILNVVVEIRKELEKITKANKCGL